MHDSRLMNIEVTYTESAQHVRPHQECFDGGAQSPDVDHAILNLVTTPFLTFPESLLLPELQASLPTKTLHLPLRRS